MKIDIDDENKNRDFTVKKNNNLPNNCGLRLRRCKVSRTAFPFVRTGTMKRLNCKNKITVVNERFRSYIYYILTISIL